MAYVLEDHCLRPALSAHLASLLHATRPYKSNDISCHTPCPSIARPPSLTPPASLTPSHSHPLHTHPRHMHAFTGPGPSSAIPTLTHHMTCKSLEHECACLPALASVTCHDTQEQPQQDTAHTTCLHQTLPAAPGTQALLRPRDASSGSQR